MNEVTNYDEETGEIVTSDPQPAGVAVQIRTEIEAQIERARRYPRSLQRARDNITGMATLDPKAADECIYALPRGNKPIRGPSIRLAEIIASQYGNCHYGGRVVSIDRFEKVVTAEGVFIDYETGLRVTRQVQRGISDRNGKLFSDDMIRVTGNAAISIAIRNAILAGIPKPIWRSAYDACESILAGNAKTLVERRDEVFKAFAAYGVTPEMIYEVLEIGGEADLDLDEIKTLRAMYGAIHREEHAVEDYFPMLREARKPGERRPKEAPKGSAEKMKELVDDKPAEQTAAEKPADGQEGAPGATTPAEGEEADSASADAAAGNAEAPGDQTAPEDGASSSQESAEVTADQVEAAKERGRQAHANRMPLRALPDDLKGQPELEKAFRDGWNEADKAAG